MFSFGNKKGNRRRQGKAAAVHRPRLDRRNAAKNIDYEIPCVSSSWEESTSLQTSRSLDLSPGSFSSQSSFRIGGSIEGEVEHLYRSLGLSGPEDFAIPIAVWEASLKARSSSDILSRSRLLDSCDVPAEGEAGLEEVRAENGGSSEVFLSYGDGDEGIMGNRSPVLVPAPLSGNSMQAEPVIGPRGDQDGVAYIEPEGSRWPFSRRSSSNDLGIRGTRPPILTPPSVSLLPPPPSMLLPTHDRSSSTWDILRSFAPVDESEFGDRRISPNSDEEGEDGDETVGSEGANEALERSAMAGETSDGTVSFSTSIDDDTSSTTTEFVISPNGRFKKHIQSWMRGQLLGSGSFGTVYEAISDDGTFIAVKEVSLLDKGSNAQQCILQLEQEIALLSQFEHENIVQYYGTDKEESKLFIFLELVTQGSLASLYQKYHLRDSQVSAYTRQILHGLNYLHERDVVHRDIKCANILVHANGSIKLADFGLAKEISKFNDLKSCKGSVYWMAPEVINPRKTYGRAADIWSLGCTVLEMLTCQIPYPNVEWQHAFYRIGRGDQPPIPGNLSSAAQDFIRKCVQVDPSDRPTAAQLLGHPFVTRKPLDLFNY